MKYFFTSAIAASGASLEAHSSEAVRDRIKEFICNETPGEILSDDRIRDNTALALNMPSTAVVISDRRYDGMTNTYYTARTSRGTYACVINGGSVMAMGMTNRPDCSRR